MSDPVTIVPKNITWDADGTRNMESGISRVVLYPISGSSYGTGVPWNGVTAINENPSGADATDLYADNIKYATLRAAENFGFTIEAYTYPDEWAECDGSKSVLTGAVSIGQQPRKAFGLCYRTEIGDDQHPGMDKGYKLHIVYNCTASPSSRSYSTINNSPDAITFSWEATSTPTKFNATNEAAGLKPTCIITVDSTKFNDQGATMEALEQLLYGKAASGGSTATNPQLPSPDDVLTALGYT